jgi:hypothetical protein
MSKRKAPEVESPLELIDRACVPHRHKLHVCKDPGRLHNNVLAYLGKALGRPLQLATKEPSLYLEFPVVDEHSRAALKALINVEDDAQVDRTLHSLCEPAAVVCGVAFLSGSGNANLMERFRALDSAGQLRELFRPLAEAALPTVPCEMAGGAWPASRALYCSAFVRCQGAVATMRELTGDLFEATLMHHIVAGKFFVLFLFLFFFFFFFFFFFLLLLLLLLLLPPFGSSKHDHCITRSSSSFQLIPSFFLMSSVEVREQARHVLLSWAGSFFLRVCRAVLFCCLSWCFVGFWC